MGARKLIFCFGISIFLGVLLFVLASEISSSCQNYPSPDFCPNGTIVANGTDANGCIIWACNNSVIPVENISTSYIILDNDSSSLDFLAAISLKNFLENLLDGNFIFEIKDNNDISINNLQDKVSVFIYKNNSLVINDESAYGILISDFPTPGSPARGAITTYLSEIYNVSYFVIPRNSSELDYNNLIFELYKGCKSPGESWQVKPSTRYNICCEDSSFNSVADEINGICNFNSEYLMCSDCGNGICESWENSCNCLVDCEDEIFNNSNSENNTGNSNVNFNNGTSENETGIGNENSENNLNKEESRTFFGKIFKWFGRIFRRR